MSHYFASIVIPMSMILLALTLDRFLGDLPNRFHPVAWMGNWIALGRRSAPKNRNWLVFGFGFAFMIGSTFGLVVFGILIQRACERMHPVANVIVQAFLLNCLFSARSLANAGKKVVEALRADDLQLARHEVAYHLVSRDTSQLNEAQLAAAAVESVAENTSDSVVAPLLFFAVAGLPGAIAYRFVNTCDAMLGYRTSELEWLGKTAAKLDDLFNLVPARVTAFLILIAACFSPELASGSARNGLHVWWQDHSKTSSPNAGHPMSAAAGVLRVELEKVDHYRLGSGQPLPNKETVQWAINLLWRVTCLSILPCLGVLFLLAFFHQS